VAASDHYNHHALTPTDSESTQVSHRISTACPATKTRSQGAEWRLTESHNSASGRPTQNRTASAPGRPSEGVRGEMKPSPSISHAAA
jgi:hypothetical protein